MGNEEMVAVAQIGMDAERYALCLKSAFWLGVNSEDLLRSVQARDREASLEGVEWLRRDLRELSEECGVETGKWHERLEELEKAIGQGDWIRAEAIADSLQHRGLRPAEGAGEMRATLEGRRSP